MQRATALFFALSILLFAPASWASDVVSTNSWNTLLHKYVNHHGRVDYAAWHKNKKDMARLDAYLAKVAKADPAKASTKARLAFYIDAYNATVIDSILTKWPVKSVMKVDGFFKKAKHTIAGQTITLDDLENKIIRAKFKEPRVHFVLVCGAKSCPRLRRKALTEKNLDKTLDAAVREFVAHASSVSGHTVTTSQIFNWFGADFKKNAGSVPAFMAKYAKGKTKKALSSGKAELKFSHYDWALNKQ